MDLHAITDFLIDGLQPLRFAPPVTHVYNPLEYASTAHELYLQLYASRPREIVLLGMNPGPWGMAQTGVPFGEVEAVREWLRIEAPVSTPAEMHPKRPVQGFACPRSEVSGKRLWGWARKTFMTPERFFARFFVINYCPLLFIESSGRNRTPNNLRAAERKRLFEICDRALLRTIEWIEPKYVVGVGQFAGERAQTVLSGLGLNLGHIAHPSPANPKANRGWGSLIEDQLRVLGIRI
jgi:single-strand selective monofunctional uracil DNA glycosylase